MLIWKKNKTSDIVTDQLSDDGNVDLTWLGHVHDLEEALQLAQQLQLTSTSTTSSSSSTSSSSTSTSSTSTSSTSATSAPSTSSTPASAVPASAANLDLTTSGSFGTVGDGLFLTTQIRSAGTGQFDTFVQVQRSGSEQGYNTDHRPQQFDEKSSANQNHSLLLSNVGVVIGDGSNGTNEGTVYREFLLDANEQSGGGKNFLSLDRLQIWQESAGNRTGFTPGTGFGAPGEHLVYDLDAGADRWIALNAGLSSGSGQSDMRLLIPDVLFDQSLPYVVVYSGFGYQGNGWAADGGFEEWGVDTASSPGHGGNSFFNVTKSATVPGGTADAAGETITYAIHVSNTGSSSLTGVTVTDPFVSNLTRGADIIGNNDAILNPGEIWSYSANHLVTQDEIDTLSVINNTATADSDQTGPDSASSTILVERNPHVTLTKAGTIEGGTVDQAGDVIQYQLTATNDGNQTLTTPTVNDPQFTTSTPITGDPIINFNVQVFTQILDGDYNLGDTDNDILEESTDHNGVQDAGETFQYVYVGDTDGNGRHDPGESWTAYNLGDTNTNGVRDLGETFVGDANNNGIEDNGEQWQFQNLGDVNHNNEQDNGEVWGPTETRNGYANAGDNNHNGVEDSGETFLYANNGFYNAGDTNHNGVEDDGETFQYIVTNTVVSVDANNDGFNDGDTNQDGKLSVGETWSYTASYTATQDDIDNRDGGGIPTVVPGLTHDNTATVTDDQQASDTASASVPITQNPHVALAKNAAVMDGVVDQAGDVIHYGIDVTNDGNMTLTGAAVSDPSVADLAAVESGGYNTGDINQDGELDLGETWHYTASYTATQDDIDNRDSEGVPTVLAGLTHDNSASVDTDQGATASGSASVPIRQNPHVTLVKDATVPGGTADHAAELIQYDIAVTNDGNMTLTSPVVSDTFASNLHGLDLNEDNFNDGDANHNGELDLLETWHYVANHVVTQAEMDAGGSINNTASVNTDQGAMASDGASVTVEQNAAVTLDKTATFQDGNNDGYAEAGEQIRYTFAVANDGNVTLHGILVNDSVLGEVSGPASGDTNSNGLLDVDETWIYQADYAITQGDIDAGTVHNDATAAASGPQNQAANANDSADVTLTPPPAPVAAMTLDKSDAQGTIFVDSNENGVADTGDGTTSGDLMEYVISLKNVSGGDIINVVLDDPLLGGDLGAPDGDANNDGILSAGEQWIWVRNYFITQDDVHAGHVDNTATATGLDAANQTVSVTTHYDFLFPTL